MAKIEKTGVLSQLCSMDHNSISFLPSAVLSSQEYKTMYSSKSVIRL